MNGSESLWALKFKMGTDREVRNIGARIDINRLGSGLKTRLVGLNGNGITIGRHFQLYYNTVILHSFEGWFEDIY